MTRTTRHSHSYRQADDKPRKSSIKQICAHWLLTTSEKINWLDSRFNGQLLWLRHRREFWRRCRCVTIRWRQICFQIITRCHSLRWMVNNAGSLLALATYNKSARSRLRWRLCKHFRQRTSRRSQSRCFGHGQQSRLSTGCRRIRHRVQHCGSRECRLQWNTNCLGWLQWTAGLINRLQVQLHSLLQLHRQLQANHILHALLTPSTTSQRYSLRWHTQSFQLPSQ